MIGAVVYWYVPFILVLVKKGSEATKFCCQQIAQICNKFHKICIPKSHSGIVGLDQMKGLIDDVVVETGMQIEYSPFSIRVVLSKLRRLVGSNRGSSIVSLGIIDLRRKFNYSCWATLLW